MFQKRVTWKCFAILLLFSVVALTLTGGLSAKAAEKEEYISAYKKYAQQQQKKSEKKLYYAIINASEDKMPVLLITDGYTDTYKVYNAAHASVYSYSDGKVVYISDVNSTGPGYPLLKKGKYIFSGMHHSSERLMVSGAKGYVDSVDGFGIEGAQCHKQSWTVANGKKKNISSTDISEKEADSMDYYMNANDNGGKAIVFKKVK